MYEKSIPGGQVATTDWIDNYPGFIEGVKGITLAENFKGQAERFGAKIVYKGINTIRQDGNIIRLTDSQGVEISTKAVLIATGSSYKKLHIPGEDTYHSIGVHYCATCDGAFYKNRRLVVVGGGNSAVQEAIFLTRFADHVDLIVRSTIKASEVLKRSLEEMEDIITVHLNTTPDSIIGDDSGVKGVLVTDTTTNISRQIDTDGVFVFIGLQPATDFLQGSNIALDDDGFIKTVTKHSTSVPGVFASGDVRSDSTRQIVSAAGDGGIAAGEIREYIEAWRAI